MRSTATGTTGAPLLRALVLAGVGVLVAVLGHALGHGAAPDAVALVAALLLSAASAIPLSGSRWSAPRLLVALGVVQVLVHGAGWLTSRAGDGVDPRLAHLTVDRAGAHAHASELTPRMVAAHILAIAVTAALLAAIEHTAAVVSAAARLVSPLLRVIVPVLAPLPLPSRAAVVLAAPHLCVVRGHAPPAPLGT